MSYLLLCTFVCGFLPGISAQAIDYETTPEPVGPSSFTCQGRASGYYADLETGCKSYHVCDGPNHFTYTCPERTLFQQRSRICDHSYLVRCEDSVHYYEGDVVYQDLDEDDFGEGEEEEEEEGEEDEGGVDYEYASNKEELEDFDEKKGELTPSPETVKTTPQEPTETTTASPTTDTDPTTTTTAAATTTKISVEYSANGNSSVGKTFLKFSLKDPRWMFYIPEVENNSIETRRTRARELVLPLDAADRRMKFKAEVEVSNVNGARALCPKFCNPRFVVPGTCHPCIMIK